MNENLKKYGINEDVIRGMVIAAKLIKANYENSMSPMDIAQCTGKRLPGKEKMKLYDESQAQKKDDVRMITEYVVSLEQGKLIPSFIQLTENY